MLSADRRRVVHCTTPDRTRRVLSILLTSIDPTEVERERTPAYRRNWSGQGHSVRADVPSETCSRETGKGGSGVTGCVVDMERMERAR